MRPSRKSQKPAAKYSHRRERDEYRKRECHYGTQADALAQYEEDECGICDV